MKRDGRWSTGGLLLAAGVLLVSACDDPATVERGMHPGTPPVLAAAAAQPRFNANRVPYRDSSVKPAVGRAGSATLTGSVVMGAAGEAELYLAAGSVAGGSPLLRQVQIKVFDADGRLLFTRNDTPKPATRRAQYSLGAIGLGARVQAQAHVVGADRARVGVVTLDVPVTRSADLEVAAIAAPARAALRSTVGIAATIREANGHLGARADCVLLVDDVEVDRAWWIWVDAGSSVTCAFRHRFERLGLAEVEVRLVDIEPADANPDNNSARTTVDVILVPSAFAYDASFQDMTFDSFWRSEYRWESADGKVGSEDQYEYSHSGREQSAYLWGWTPRALTFPLDELQLKQMTRDEVVHNVQFLGLEPDWSYSGEWGSEACIMRWFDTPNGINTFYLCSMEWAGETPYTYVSYSRQAGDVTYHSRGEYRWWDHDTGDGDYWSWNYGDTSSVGRMVSYGHEYGFFIYVADANGIYRMQPLVWLEPFSEAYQEPWSCWEYSDEWSSSRYCSEGRMEASGVRGWVDGWPTY